MKSRYILAPEAALDLVEIWRHIKGKAGCEIADKAEVVIRGKLVLLAANPGVGHCREDLTDEPVKFFHAHRIRRRIGGFIDG